MKHSPVKIVLEELEGLRKINHGDPLPYVVAHVCNLGAQKEAQARPLLWA